MSYHIIIKEEKRTQPRAVNKGTPQERSTPLVTPWKWSMNGVPQPDQLNVLPEHVERITSFDNIAYAASWDGVSPYVEVLAGGIADIGLAYMGWPMKTKEQFEAERVQLEAEQEAEA